MRKKNRYIMLGLLFLIGLSILLYPTISNLWNEYRAKQLISSYDQQIKKTDHTDLNQMLEAAVSYNQTLKDVRVPDAFSIRDGLKDQEYESLLNPEHDGIMGTVDIPKIDVKLPIYHYTDEEVLKKGAGHLFGSSLPVGGENTHAVISAHRGLPSAELFTNLNLLENKDCFYLHILGETLTYEIDEIFVVQPDETESLGITKGEDLVTLVTCTPYAVNTQRLLVRGHRIPYQKQIYRKAQEKIKKSDSTSVIIRILCVAAGVLIAIIIVWILNRRKNINE